MVDIVSIGTVVGFAMNNIIKIAKSTPDVRLEQLHTPNSNDINCLLFLVQRNER